MKGPEEITEGEKIRYSRFKPEMYRPKMSIFWWVKRPPYLQFILRETTSLFVGMYAILMLIQLNALRQDAGSWEALISWFQTPLSITLHVVIFLFVMFHSLTWLQLTPKVMDIRIRGMKIPDGVIVAANIFLWLIISLAIVLVVI